MPSVRGWILIPYLPHKAIKSSVSTNPPSRKAASARFNDALSRASSCRCRRFSRSIRTCSRLRSSAAYSSRIRARCPFQRPGIPTQRFEGCHVRRRNPLEVLHTALHGGSQVASFRSPRFDTFLAEHSSAKHTSGFETNVADTQYDDNYIVRLTEPVFYNGVPSDVFVQEGHIFIGRDDPVIPTCGLTQ